MINQRKAEFTVGLFIIAAFISLLVLAVKVSGLTSYVGSHGMTLMAQFDNVGDLKVRAPVSIAGVRIGQVQHIQLDPQTYRAAVKLFIEPNAGELPSDTSAHIFTEGLLGSNYINLEPGYGADNQSLKDGDTIQTTYSALILEDIIGKVLFKLSNGDEKENEGAAKPN